MNIRQQLQTGQHELIGDGHEARNWQRQTITRQMNQVTNIQWCHQQRRGDWTRNTGQTLTCAFSFLGFPRLNSGIYNCYIENQTHKRLWFPPEWHGSWHSCHHGWTAASVLVCICNVIIMFDIMCQDSPLWDASRVLEMSFGPSQNPEQLGRVQESLINNVQDRNQWQSRRINIFVKPNRINTVAWLIWFTGCELDKANEAGKRGSGRGPELGRGMMRKYKTEWVENRMAGRASPGILTSCIAVLTSMVHDWKTGHTCDSWTMKDSSTRTTCT